MAAGAENPSCKKNQQLGLLELPELWMAQLVRLLSLEDKLVMFETCKILRDAVLSHAPGTRLSLQLVQPEHLMLGRGHSLAMASSKAGNISLTLIGEKHREAQPEGVFLFTCAMSKLDGSPLTGIQHITMQNLVLDTIIPQWIACACPNVTTVQLDKCYVCYYLQPHAHLPLTQLRALRVAAASSVVQPEYYVREQLQAMPGLTEISISNISAGLAQSFGVLGGTLTKFEWLADSRHNADGFRAMMVQFPNLQQLTINNPLVGLNVIAHMTALTKLVAVRSLFLRQPLSEPCKWPTDPPFILQVGDINTRSLCKLPQGRAMVIEGRPTKLNQSKLIITSRGPSETEVLSWLSDTPDVRFHCNVFTASLTMSAAAVAGLILKLTPSCTHIVLRKLHNNLTPEAVAVVANAISQIPNRLQLTLRGYNRAESLHQLLPVLPGNIHTVQLERPRKNRQVDRWVHDLNLMCSNALRPIDMILKCRRLSTSRLEHLTHSFAKYNVTLKQWPRLPDDTDYDTDDDDNKHFRDHGLGYIFEDDSDYGDEVSSSASDSEYQSSDCSSSSCSDTDISSGDSDSDRE